MPERRHEMPFGAEFRPDGTRFSLWAPGARSVELVLGDEVHALRPDDEGFYSLTTAAAPGDRYSYRIDGEHLVPDPASRHQPDGVHGPSAVVDPAFDPASEWQGGRDTEQGTGWRGRPWEEAVLYELHVGTFTPAGTFAGVRDRLDYLAGLGVTGIELMPLSAFPGSRNWGYDGVLPYAPDGSYGTPEELKELVRAAHERGLMVLLDVVYNHFGPEGNYLHLYAPQFFTDRYETPWGAAIDFASGPVREFFIHNALYWLEEYDLDGLRLDAVQEIRDGSEPHFLDELADRVRTSPGRERRRHLVLENDDNRATYLREGLYEAQWNDDLHHALHVVATGESGGYYEEYAQRPVENLGQALAEGFVYQGEESSYRDGAARGEPSGHLSPLRFVSFVQNHDQVGNRALGDRLTSLASPAAARAVCAIYLLAPAAPMLFMGEEWAAAEPFPFFCDFGEELSAAVTQGRREEFARFPEFSGTGTLERIPDPNDPETFQSAVLEGPVENEWLALYRELLKLRHEQEILRLQGIPGGAGEYHVIGERVLRVEWLLGDGSRLTLLANLGDGAVEEPEAPAVAPLYCTGEPGAAWSVAWYLQEEPGGE